MPFNPLPLLSTLSPPAAAALGWRLFWDLGTPERVHPRDADVHERARRSELSYGPRRIAVYEWGEGPAVLLVHGWRSRASRFSALVRELETDHTVVAFDAPGNGDSAGERTTGLEYAAIVAELSERYGGFDTVVGHSLGVVAAFIAVRDLGAQTRRIAGIAGVHDFDHVMDAFTTKAGLSEPAARRFRDRFATWGAPVMGDPWRRLQSRLPEDRTVPLFIAHDRDDAEVAVHQAMRIAEAHPGTQLMLTDGLGHNRIVGDPGVVAAIGTFARSAARQDALTR